MFSPKDSIYDKKGLTRWGQAFFVFLYRWGLPHQSADWFAMTQEQIRLPQAYALTMT